MSEPGGERYAIVVARFYEELADRLVAGAQRVLGGEADVYDVPGAFELPVAAKLLAQSGRYAGIVCLGAVIRGATGHYEHVAGQCAAGVQRAQLDTGVPVVFGVLTTDTTDQALERAGGKGGNKGLEAATAAIEMADLLRQLPKRGPA